MIWTTSSFSAAPGTISSEPARIGVARYSTRCTVSVRGLAPIDTEEGRAKNRRVEIRKK